MANFLTSLRIILAFIALWLLFSGVFGLYILAFVLTLVVIALDGLDGYVARKLNETSKFGSVFDILADRIVENAYWVTFACLGWVGVWLPIVILSRGIITDGLRSVALAEGFTAFGETSMIKNKIGNFITASRFSRGAYGTAKVLAFVLLILAHTPLPEGFEPEPEMLFGLGYIRNPFIFYGPTEPITFVGIAMMFAYIAVAFCIIRGIPVILESKQFFTKNDKQ